MNLVGFVRILMSHILVLFLVPVIMASIIFFLTRNEEKKYVSNTVLYTGIASGYSIESQSNSRVDFFAVNNAFDNFINIIKSRKNLTEVALYLFAQNMMLKQPNPEYISTKHYNELQNSVPDSLKALINNKSIELTVRKLDQYLKSNNTNYLYKLINKEEKHYSIKTLSKVDVKRYQNSDLLEISFQSNDPGICKQTLILLVKSVINNYTEIKQNQTADVVRYFEEQLAISEKRLKKAENDLLHFNQKNNIINYYEQTKYIASQKEDLDLEHQKEQMTLHAAEVVIKTLEKKLNSNQQIKLYSSNIMKKRKELSKISSKIALLEVASVNDSINKPSKKEIENLKVKARLLRDDLTTAVNSLYLSENTTEGVPSEKILEDWLKNVIKYEESKARIVILNNRREEFKKVYVQFAPLGATIKRIEREINVAEREYLSLLHSLALAKLKQQNIELSSSIKMVDKPFFPLEPLASKRKFLIAIGGIAGFVIVVFIIIALEYLDVNIKTPRNAKRLTGLDVVGVYPRILKKYKKQGVDFDFVINRTTELLIQNLKQKQINSKSKPFKILFFSTRKWDGKTMLANRMAELLRELNYKVLFLTHDSKANEKFYKKEDSDAFSVEKSLINISSIEDMIMFPEFCNVDSYDFVFVVIPAINKNPYPIELLAKIDATYMICRANRPWGLSDAAALDRIQISFGKIVPEVILNSVELPVVEEVIGELPKKRSWIRIIVKRILKRQFFSVKKIKEI